jgi:hypothetical protein
VVIVASCEWAQDIPIAAPISTADPAPAYHGAVRTFRLVAASALALLGACDFLLQGTHTGQCDEPSSIYFDGGDPGKARQAQCQAMGDICCRTPAAFNSQVSRHTTCEQPMDCRLADLNGDCYGDVDCQIGLGCVGAVMGVGGVVQAGKCQCPMGGMYCPPDPVMQTPFYCCPVGNLCGTGSCEPPPPPDMTIIDLRAAPPDLRRD